MSDYKHGDMDVEEHWKTLHGFIRIVATCGIVAFAVLILLALVNS